MTDRADATELLAALEAGVAELVSGDDWAAMLDMSAKLYRYSWRNQMLIALQGGSGYVAGYKAWQGMGRQVRKGSTGIRILAPCVVKAENPATGEKESKCVGFRATSVFDISTTDGPELPATGTLLVGDAPDGLWDDLADQVSAAGFSLAREVIDGSANGYTAFGSKSVVVRPDVSDAQSVETLAHELAHVLLHGDADRPDCKGQVEVEAESVAYIVTQAMGMDTTAYSFPYVAGWSGGKSETVADSGERIVRCARGILEAMASESEVAA